MTGVEGCVGRTLRGLRVLIVDDDPAVPELLQLYLDREGFEVSTAADGREAMRLYREWCPDLILLDLSLPLMHGLEVCRAIRRTSHVPIIIVSGLTEEVDRVGGLELGADDYITKPFSPLEVVARVKAVLRGCALAAGAGQEIALAGLRIDLSQRRVEVKGEEVHLTPSEFRLLWCLASQPGHVLRSHELARCALGSSLEFGVSNIALHLQRLRKKLKGHGEDMITTVRGLGYRLDISGAGESHRDDADSLPSPAGNSCHESS
jgi:DNA-binding response OmpR family regulator